MLADHAARVLARRTRFGAEARRERGDADRQLGLVGDLLAHEIGERHFGGGNEPEGIPILESNIYAFQYSSNLFTSCV